MKFTAKIIDRNGKTSERQVIANSKEHAAVGLKRRGMSVVEIKETMTDNAASTTIDWGDNNNSPSSQGSAPALGDDLTTKPEESVAVDWGNGQKPLPRKVENNGITADRPEPYNQTVPQESGNEKKERMINIVIACVVILIAIVIFSSLDRKNSSGLIHFLRLLSKFL